MAWKDKVALITGAHRGIGRDIVLCLAEEGARIPINYRSHADEARELVKALEQNGHRALAWQADVADRDQTRRMVRVSKVIHSCFAPSGNAPTKADFEFNRTQ